MRSGAVMTTRREFVGAAMSASVLSTMYRPASAKGGLKILILGGTGFIGPHLVQQALDRGHSVTLFNRGRTNTHLFPGVEKLVGDRNDNLSALESRRWDAVIDNSGYTPHQVNLSVNLLKDASDQYLFTSTRGVYADFRAKIMDEDAPIGPKDPPDPAWNSYRDNKVLSERIVQEAFGVKTLITRPPIIVGPGDRTDRFTYWVDRIDDGGDILVQGDSIDPVQFVDVRDLAEFYVHLLEQSTSGTFNTVGPGSPLTNAGLVHGIKAITTTPSTFTWVDWDFLIGEGEVPQETLPFWYRPSGRYLHYGRMVNTRAIGAGMTFRPLAITARDTLDWHRTRSAEQQDKLRVGLSRDREAALLQKWRSVVA